MKPATKRKLTRLLAIKEELDLRKALYEEYDRLIVELAREGFESAPLGDLILTVEDKFAEGCNTGWTSAAVRRYDLRVESAEKAARRAQKERK